ncbi:hypothetical protein OB905_13155 [Halobacteria archaeon AArc-dxtr1]|nr:hypothetical protein [Halobacteria archaeon AArc-dxtr1]
MSQALSRAALGFGVLLVGLLTTIAAADLAYDGADSEADVLDTFHPVAETVLPLLPLIVLFVAVFGLIGAAAWFLNTVKSGSGGGYR